MCRVSCRVYRTSERRLGRRWMERMQNGLLISIVLFVICFAFVPRCFSGLCTTLSSDGRVSPKCGAVEVYSLERTIYVYELQC